MGVCDWVGGTVVGGRGRAITTAGSIIGRLGGRGVTFGTRDWGVGLGGAGISMMGGRVLGGIAVR